MIPHAPPARFPLFDGRVLLPLTHPLAVDGVYPSLALIELAAQAAGHAVVEALGAEGAGHAGMLVEIESATIHRPRVPGGEVLTVEVRLDRVMGPLRRYRVHIPTVLEVGLTLRIV